MKTGSLTTIVRTTLSTLLITTWLVGAQPPAREPIAIYLNWASYDELSKHTPVRLTEELAMKELDQVLRLRQKGVRIDYYVMDVFWWDPENGYRTWRKQDWPNGGDPWLKKCIENGIKPGLWLATNTMPRLKLAPTWRDSIARGGSSLSLFEGGFLSDLISTMQYWYDRGVRLFKLDFGEFGAATLSAEQIRSRAEIWNLNQNALIVALHSFRQKNPEVVLLGYNTFVEDNEQLYNTSTPFHKAMDTRWLEAFDSLYAGDPRPSDVPAANFWRSNDMYSDHVVRRLEENGFPLERIDSSSFMIGDTETAYWRKTAGWKGMLLLSLARGGWMNTYYGSLEMLSDEDVAWFARLQRTFLPLQSLGRTHSFGGLPGQAQPYGFATVTDGGAWYTVVNPRQATALVLLPSFSPYQVPLVRGRVQFRDAGFRAQVDGDTVTLGPEQLALVGYGKFAGGEYDFGEQSDVRIPDRISPLPTKLVQEPDGSVAVSLQAPAEGDIRIILRQTQPDGLALRSGGYMAPDTNPMFFLAAQQGGQALPVGLQFTRYAWPGLSWLAGEIKAGSYRPGESLKITGRSLETREKRLAVEVYNVQ